MCKRMKLERSCPLPIFKSDYLGFFFFELYELFIYLRQKSLIRYMICKYFLQFCMLSFHFVDGLLCCTVVCLFVQFSLISCCLCFWCQIQKKSFFQNLCQGVYPLFFSKSFMVSGLLFKSLINFELILCVVPDRGPVSYFCIWLSSFPSNMYFYFLYSWL